MTIPGQQHRESTDRLALGTSSKETRCTFVHAPRLIYSDSPLCCRAYPAYSICVFVCRVPLCCHDGIPYVCRFCLYRSVSPCDCWSRESALSTCCATLAWYQLDARRASKAKSLFYLLAWPFFAAAAMSQAEDEASLHSLHAAVILFAVLGSSVSCRPESLRPGHWSTCQQRRAAVIAITKAA